MSGLSGLAEELHALDGSEPPGQDSGGLGLTPGELTSGHVPNKDGAGPALLNHSSLWKGVFFCTL